MAPRQSCLIPKHYALPFLPTNLSCGRSFVAFGWRGRLGYGFRMLQQAPAACESAWYLVGSSARGLVELADRLATLTIQIKPICTRDWRPMLACRYSAVPLGSSGRG